MKMQQAFESLADYIVKNNLNVYKMVGIDNSEILKKEFKSACITNNCFSVSKNITATIIGILICNGKLNLNDKVVNFFADVMPKNVDSKWNNVTIYNLLTHTTGQQKGTFFEEQICKSNIIDHLKEVFKETLKYNVNEHFEYSNLGGYLLARIIEKIYSKSYFEVFTDLIAKPLDFKHFGFVTCPMGRAMGATGINLRTEDLAKLAFVYANDGKYNNKQIIPKQWIDIASKNAITIENGNRSYTAGCFWRLKDYPQYFGDGKCCQLMFVDSKNNFGIAMHGYETTATLPKILLETLYK